MGLRAVKVASTAAGAGGARRNLDGSVHILWFHSTEVDKGEVSKGYYSKVIAKCMSIKVKGVLIGEAEHTWCLTMGGQPSWGKSKNPGEPSWGKIVCLNQRTVDFWVKMVPIASKMVGNISCKAWTEQEYKTKVVRYSCLIPKTCNEVDLEDLVNATLQMRNVYGLEGVVTCCTTYTLRQTNKFVT